MIRRCHKLQIQLRRSHRQSGIFGAHINDLISEHGGLEECRVLCTAEASLSLHAPAGGVFASARLASGAAASYHMTKWTKSRRSLINVTQYVVSRTCYQARSCNSNTQSRSRSPVFDTAKCRTSPSILWRQEMRSSHLMPWTLRRLRPTIPTPLCGRCELIQVPEKKMVKPHRIVLPRAKSPLRKTTRTRLVTSHYRQRVDSNTVKPRMPRTLGTSCNSLSNSTVRDAIRK